MIEQQRKVYSRNIAIDFLKIVFTLIVVLNHGLKYLPGQPAHFYHSRMAVEFFFIVSGYLLAVSAKRCTGSREVSVWKQMRGFIGHKIALLAPDVFIAWFTAFAVMYMMPPGKNPVQDFLSGIFEFFFLREAGFTGFTQANGPVWYISAMLLSMAVLFPVLAGKREFFLHWFAPLAAIFLYGWLSVKFGKIVGEVSWAGFAAKGLIRALAGLCLGCVCYAAAEKLRQYRLRLSGKILANIIALLSIVYVIYAIYTNKPSSFDFVIIILLALGITLIFSNTGPGIFGYVPDTVKRGITFLGEFSLDLFLSHSYWSIRLGDFLPDLTGGEILRAYFLISIVNAALLMLVSKILKKNAGHIKKGFGRLIFRIAGENECRGE